MRIVAKLYTSTVELERYRCWGCRACAAQAGVCSRCGETLVDLADPEQREWFLSPVAIRAYPGRRLLFRVLRVIWGLWLTAGLLSVGGVSGLGLLQAKPLSEIAGQLALVALVFSACALVLVGLLRWVRVPDGERGDISPFLLSQLEEIWAAENPEPAMDLHEEAPAGPFPADWEGVPVAPRVPRRDL